MTPSTPDLIAGLGNHEAKALLMLHLSSSAHFQTEYSMSAGFRDFVGPGAEWYPTQGGPFQYCLASLEPIGQVLRGTVRSSNGHLVDAYKVSEFGENVGVPAAGLLLGWSLDVPDLSVQKVLGPTHSKGAVRAPQNRLEALSRMVDSSATDMSTVDIAGLSSEDFGSPAYRERLQQTDLTTRALARVALVHIERQSDQNPRRYRVLGIDSPQACGPKPTGVTNALRSYINRRYETGQPEFSIEDCVAQVVAELQQTDVKLDPAIVRHRILTMLTSRQRSSDGSIGYKYFPQLERLESPYAQYHTRISLNESYRAAISALLEIVMSLDRRDVIALKRGKALAAEISADSEKKVALLDKAYRFSAYAQRGSQDETRQAVKAILAQQTEPIDTITLHQLYTERYRHVSQAVVGKALRQLVKTEDVAVVQRRARDVSLKRRNYYTLIEHSGAP